MVGIYKITSPSGRVYIGQSWRIEYRWGWHRSGTKKGLLAKSFNRYGFDNHKREVIHELPADVSQEVMDGYEQLYIDQYRELGFRMLNLKDAGSFGKHHIESRKKISESLKGHKRNLGRVMDEDTKMKISLANKGKKRDEATRERMSIKKIGNKNGAGPGRVCGKRGPMSAETKMKIAERLKGNQNSKKKTTPVIQYPIWS
jgi:group I intron endonuclease